MRGHIRKRGKRWALVIPLGSDPVTRKPRQKWYSFKTRGEAEAHRAQIVAQMASGGWTPPSNIRLGDFCLRWLDDYARGAVGPVTMRNYRTIITEQIAPKLGHIPLDRLSAQTIQDFLSELLHRGGKHQQGLHPNSVHKAYRVLSEILNHAVRWGLLARREVRVWDEEQVRLFLAEAKRSSRCYPLFLTAIMTGMRSGELAGLTWANVDLALGVASVRQTFTRLGRERLFKEPKTSASRRAIALPAVVVEALRALQDEQQENRRLLGPGYRDHDLVFSQADGKPLHMHNVVRRDFRRVMKKAGVPRITFHDLRHAHASYLARAGVPAKVAQERLGHSTPHFTMQIYTHVLAGQQEAAAKAVERYVLGLS